MLQAAPDAFFTQYTDVAELDEATWRERIAAQCHFQARLDDDPVGSVGVWDDPETPDDASTLVAMYVAPRARAPGWANAWCRRSSRRPRRAAAPGSCSR